MRLKSGCKFACSPRRVKGWIYGGLKLLGGQRFDNHMRLGPWRFVGDGHMHMRHHAGRRHRLQSFQRATGQLHGRFAGRQIGDTHIAEEHTLPETGAERLTACFLGREPFGVGREGVATALCLVALGRGENAFDKTIAKPLDSFFDAPYIDNIVADAQNHFRTLFIKCRILYTAAFSPTNNASPIKAWPIFSSTTSLMAAIGFTLS